jgi:uridine kinase
VTDRARVIASLASAVCRDAPGHPTRVAVDGVTASGKTTLAGELAAAVAVAGRPAVHLTMDGFHHPRAHRHRRGRTSARGYYEDAYDVAAFAREVLVPLGPGGSRRYRTAIRDLASDEPIDEAPVEAPEDAVVIVDGSFLRRPELVDLWDHRIYVDTTLEVARRRGTQRDASLFGGVARAEELYDARYHAACRLYLAAVDPARRATVVVENDDPAHPSLR